MLGIQDVLGLTHTHTHAHTQIFHLETKDRTGRKKEKRKRRRRRWGGGEKEETGKERCHLSGGEVCPERIRSQLLLVVNLRAITTCAACGSKALFSGLTYEKINMRNLCLRAVRSCDSLDLELY